MTVPKADPEAVDRRSLHERIAADLRDEIMGGELAPGANLPTTAQLKERFGASSATVQKGLQLLKDEGLVVGRAGAAVTVREHRRRTVRPAAPMVAGGPGSPYPWLAEAARHGTDARIRLLDVTERRPPADVRAALGLPPDGTAVLRAQILLVDEEPAELVEAYYPLDIARGTALSERRRIRGGASALLTALGHPPRRSTDRVCARVPTQAQYQALRLTSGMPVLRTLRVVHGDAGRPVEVTVMVKAGHLYELQYEFTPQHPEPPPAPHPH
ncbi:GntR family transcriptional regulator [Streptomyces asoensis]|uniref:GntR family transcriptional regulator n=4 Tax=Streptomyces TaxID=1883 RepID=A0ABQ3RSC6_9ACTN|nr:GntR family transcriptional regulator [Streptomyces asoensis]GGQ46302.1 GntR family transcriptional regulator [Streptomyces asoensis]GHI58752.1 GntR family transcriptional regulator [Streptomyces asoensis]